MKEKIYTIPINEAMEKDTECPFCYLLEKCEEEAVSFALGASMMEPDYRIESNEKGYCAKHFRLMLEKPEKLSLSLVMKTHMEETLNKLSSFGDRIEKLKQKKTGLLRKSDSAIVAKELSAMLKNRDESCVICDKINYTMSRYIEVFLDMWRTEPQFRKTVEESKGVCLVHMRMLLEASCALGDKDRIEFLSFLYEKQHKELIRIKQQVHRFTLKFDYRNKDMELGTAAEAPLRSIEKTVGTISKAKDIK